MTLFRKLKADEIELRVGNVTERGATLLLYKDARCDMNILDETVGAMNWQRDHKEVKGVMYCGISIWDENKKQWVAKWDAGTESNTEQQKGEASDSFKRSDVNWGIGRELYTAPMIFIPCDTIGNGGKFKMAKPYEFSNHRVSLIEYTEDGTICKLQIKDKANKVVWDMNTYVEPQKVAKKVNQAAIKGLQDYLDKNHIDAKVVCAKFGIKQLEDMTEEMLSKYREEVKK